MNKTKTFSIISSLIPTLLMTILLFGAVGYSMMGASANEQGAAEQENGEASMTENSEADSGRVELTEESEDAVLVTITDLSTDTPYSIDLLGTVASESQVMVYPAVNGQVTAANIEEGEKVEKGDVIFILGGMNDTVHPLLKQYEIAKTNYESAKKLYSATSESTSTAIRSAELQLESARHQTEGSYIDYQAMARNIEASKDGIGLIRNTIGETMMKNERDLDNMRQKILDMEDALEDFDDTRRDTIDDIIDMIDDAADDASRAALEEQLEKTRDELSAKRDELENALEELENGYEAMQSGAVMAENQLYGQLQQAQNQEHQLYMTADSMQWKLGLFDGSSDPVKLAEQGYAGAKAQARSALTQAETALELARINLELAADQKQYLLVKAPVGGAVSAVNVKEGDVASPQAPIAQITGTNDNVLKLYVDADSASLINQDTKAEVMIGGRYVNAPVKSVSPVADPVSKMVTVTLNLPNISIRPNSSMQARLMLNPSKSDNEEVIFVPLDAVTIGTENQFLFIQDGDRAKKVNVKLGKISGEMIEILEGLNGNEKVITGGAREVLDGQKIIIN